MVGMERSGSILSDKRAELPDMIRAARGAAKRNAHMLVLDNWMDASVFNGTSLTGLMS